MNRRPRLTRIAMVTVQSRVTVAGVIRSVTTEAVGPSPAVRCVLADGSGQLDLLFLGRASVAGLRQGRRCTAEGRACDYQGRLVLWNPRYELASSESPDEPPADEDGSARRVLVVGDDPGLSRVIEVNLAVRGYRVDAVVASAADSALDGRPNLVIVDLGVADADGMEPVKALRGRLGRVPVIAVSARDSEEVKRAALAAGAADFLTKPFHINDLLRTVRRASTCREGDGATQR